MNPHDEVIYRLMAEEYVDKILSITYMNPMSVQSISRVCGIPIAVAYRRISKMESLGLLRCVRLEKALRGRGVKYYQCTVRMLNFSFLEGYFDVSVNWLPECVL